MKPRTIWLIAGILGVNIFIIVTLTGCALILLLILGIILDPSTANAAALLQMSGLVGLGAAIGIPLAVVGLLSWRERPAQTFAPPHHLWRWLLLIPLLLVLLASGAIIGWLAQATPPWLPQTIHTHRPLIEGLLLSPVHILAMTLSPLIVLGLVGWGLRGSGGSRRGVIAGIAGGGCLGLILSLIAEVLIIISVVVIVAAIVVATPGGLEKLTQVSNQLSELGLQTDPDPRLLADIISSPIVLLSAFVGFCIIVPLIEEAFKTLAGGIASYWLRPSPARAFLWGVAAGAGFALAENLLNGAASGTDWVGLSAARIGTTAMHCMGSGLTGWGWGQLWTQRRPLRLPAMYALSVMLHGLWNTAAIGMGFMSIAASAYEDSPWHTVAQVGQWTAVAIVVLISILLLVALPIIARKLSRREQGGGWHGSPPT